MMGVRSEHRWVEKCIRDHRAVTDRQREREVAFRPPVTRGPVVAPRPLPGRAQVRAWMRRNVDGCEPSATILAQTAAVEMDLPVDWLEDETHWLWEIAQEEASDD